MATDGMGRFFVSGGTVPVDSPSYVEREADRLLLEALLEGRYCYVLNSRQIGKSSLSVHTLGRLRVAGRRAAYLDLTRIGGQNITAEQWYMGIALEIARELNLGKELIAYWRANVEYGPMQRFFRALQHVVLAQVEEPVVIFIDEIDATRSLPFDADEFFAGIRECFNQRVVEPSLQRLSFCLIGVAVPSDLVRNPATTPFNVGERIPLEDFTLEEMGMFAKALGEGGDSLVQRVHYWTGGHPYLSQTICRALARSEVGMSVAIVDAIVERELFDFKVRTTNINLADVANIALHYGDAEPDPLKFRADLLSAYERILLGKKVADDESNRVAVVLKLSGIAKTDGKRLSVRNRIYRHVFDRDWIEENMPGQELRRIQQSYRRGIGRAAAVAAAVLLTLSIVSAYAWISRRDAIDAKTKLDYHFYAADINSLSAFFSRGDTNRIQEILKRQAGSPYRGFEWAYWLTRFHDSPEEYTLDYEAPGKREEGHISADGRQLCLVDDLLHVAVVVDRRTKTVTSTAMVRESDVVSALRDRFVVLREHDWRTQIVDLVSGRPLCIIGEPGWFVGGKAPVDHSDFIATVESSKRDLPATRLRGWDAQTGKKIFDLPLETPTDGLLAVAEPGRRILYSLATDRPTVRGIAVYDWISKRKVDGFELPTDTRFIGFGSLGRWAIFENSRFQRTIRDIDAHRFTPWESPSIKPVNKSLSLDNDRLLVSIGAGLESTVSDFPGNGQVTVRQNVLSVNPGVAPGEFVAGATSVRVYRAHEMAIPQVFAKGIRITRYAPGKLNVFVPFPTTIRRFSESSLLPDGEFPAVKGPRDYTYNGRWCVVLDDNGEARRLISVDGKIPPRELPFPPAIWACGLDLDYVACWSQSLGRLVMMSARTGKIRWQIEPFTATQAMWISPNSQRLFTVRDNLYVHVYDTQTGKEVGVLSGHNMGPINLTFSSDGTRFFTCGGDGRAVMWDLPSLRKLTEFRGNALDPVTSADLAPDGRRVVTTGRSGSWQLWDAANGVQLLDVAASTLPLSSALFTADGSRILTAGEDQQVRIWPTVAKDPTVYLPVPPELLSRIHS